MIAVRLAYPLLLLAAGTLLASLLLGEGRRLNRRAHARAVELRARPQSVEPYTAITTELARPHRRTP